MGMALGSIIAAIITAQATRNARNPAHVHSIPAMPEAAISAMGFGADVPIVVAGMPLMASDALGGPAGSVPPRTTTPIGMSIVCAC